MIKKIVPTSIKESLKNSFISFADKMQNKAEQMKFAQFHCPVCDNPVTSFKAYDRYQNFQYYQHRFSHFALETFNFSQYWCPHCHANDRDRLFALYLDERFSQIDKSKRYNFVEFAPETVSLAKRIKSYSFLNYRSADLYMPGVDDQIDLQDMSVYHDDYAHFYICSHILEHVEDDRKAMRELYRILNPDGFGLLMVPIQLDLDEVYEDPKITAPEDRWREFGQDTHVRMYSKQGFVARLEEAGFKVSQLGKEHFGEEVFKLNGIYPRSVLYVVEK